MKSGKPCPISGQGTCCKAPRLYLANYFLLSAYTPKSPVDKFFAVEAYVHAEAYAGLRRAHSRSTEGLRRSYALLRSHFQPLSGIRIQSSRNRGSSDPKIGSVVLARLCVTVIAFQRPTRFSVWLEMVNTTCASAQIEQCSVQNNIHSSLSFHHYLILNDLLPHTTL